MSLAVIIYVLTVHLYLFFTRLRLIEYFLDIISSYPSKLKIYLYEYQPYKQYIWNYTHMQVSGRMRKICYFLLMLVLLPLLFPLAAVYFVVSGVIVLISTLILLPLLVWIDKKVSLWIPIVYYPVMVVYYMGPLYFGRFLPNQFVDLVTFYLNYTKTMFVYLLTCCKSNSS